jgi:hypothetical protein
MAYSTASLSGAASKHIDQEQHRDWNAQQPEQYVAGGALLRLQRCAVTSNHGSFPFKSNQSFDGEIVRNVSGHRQRFYSTTGGRTEPTPWAYHGAGQTIARPARAYPYGVMSCGKQCGCSKPVGVVPVAA